LLKGDRGEQALTAEGYCEVRGEESHPCKWGAIFAKQEGTRARKRGKLGRCGQRPTHRVTMKGRCVWGSNQWGVTGLKVGWGGA